MSNENTTLPGAFAGMENALATERQRAEAAEARAERAEALLREADRRIVWEGVGLRRSFQDDVEALLQSDDSSSTG